MNKLIWKSIYEQWTYLKSYTNRLFWLAVTGTLRVRRETGIGISKFSSNAWISSIGTSVEPSGVNNRSISITVSVSTIVAFFIKSDKIFSILCA